MSDTTAITEAQYTAAVLRCVQAIEDEDWASARRYCLAADAVAAGLPVSASSAGASAARRASLRDLQRQIMEEQARALMDTSASRRIDIPLGRPDHGA